MLIIREEYISDSFKDNILKSPLDYASIVSATNWNDRMPFSFWTVKLFVPVEKRKILKTLLNDGGAVVTQMDVDGIINTAHQLSPITHVICSPSFKSSRPINKLKTWYLERQRQNDTMDEIGM